MGSIHPFPLGASIIYFNFNFITVTSFPKFIIIFIYFPLSRKWMSVVVSLIFG